MLGRISTIIEIIVNCIVCEREIGILASSLLGFSNKADCFDLKAKTVYSNVNVLFYHLQVSS
jgi:hypothetical protein